MFVENWLGGELVNRALAGRSRGLSCTLTLLCSPTSAINIMSNLESE